jgi:hypothetical protein
LSTAIGQPPDSLRKVPPGATVPRNNNTESGRAIKKLIAQAFIVCVINIALADPITPPEHAEKEYRTLGGGLFLQRDQELTPDEDGNVSVALYSHNGVSAGAGYTVDLNAVLPEAPGEVAIDAGALGILRVQFISIDCARKTYQVFNTRRVLPQPIWRAASSLPALAPVFSYVCSHLRAPTAS